MLCKEKRGGDGLCVPSEPMARAHEVTPSTRFLLPVRNAAGVPRRLTRHVIGAPYPDHAFPCRAAHAFGAGTLVVGCFIARMA